MRILICVLSLIVCGLEILNIAHNPISSHTADEVVLYAPYIRARHALFIVFLVFEAIIILISIKKYKTWKERIKYIVLPTIYMFLQNFIIATISFM